MRFQPRWFGTLIVACVLAGCASSTGSSDDWTRSYIAPKENVFDAVVDVLDDEGYFVDADRDSGRITAEPPRSSRGSSPTLYISVAERSGKMRVDIQTRAGATGTATQGVRIDAVIVEIFHELELRLQGLKD